MLGASLFGGVAQLKTKSRGSKRPAHTRAAFEPLEQRNLLTASAWINEIYFNPPGGDDTVTPWEYMELRGTAEYETNDSLDNHYLIFIENEDNPAHTGNAGKIDKILDLSGEQMGSNGFLVLRKPGNPYTIDPDATDLVYPSDSDIEGGGFTAMLIHTDGQEANLPSIGQDLDERVNSLTDTPGALNGINDGLDFLNGHPGWTILDAIGIHGESDEPVNGRLYAQVNFGAGNADTHLEPGALYFKVPYEIEYAGRWGNSTGQAEADWHVSNLTDNSLSGYIGTGDFRQSGSGMHPNVTTVETNKGVPYGTNLTGSVGSSNYPHVPVVDLNGGTTGDGINYSTSWNDSGPVSIADNLLAKVTDDDVKLLSITAAIQGAPDPTNVLAATGSGGISVSYNATSGVLTMTGASSVANYQTVLRTITYDNSDDGPGPGPVTVNIVATDAIGGVSGTAVATVSIPVVNSTIAARKLFYNNSSFDGASAAINFTSDNNAVATDKSAYLPDNTTAVFNNVSSFTLGITGIIVDLSTTGGSHGAITASDFIFKVGNNNLPSSWAAAPAPASVAVSTGFGGNDRVEITWAANAIKNQWLEVQVKANANTGLAVADVFFWGNKVGDTGNPSATDFSATVAGDGGEILTHLGSGGGIANNFDINRTNSVTVSGDRGDVVANLGTITRIKISAAGPFAPEGGGGGTESGGDAGISSALAGSAAKASSQPIVSTVARSPSLRVAAARIAAIDAALASSVATDKGTTDNGDSDLEELFAALAAGT